MADLYEADVLEWSEQQARLLRRLAAGQAGNESPDWANIIEEVESVGRSEFNAVQSLLVQALAHDLRCRAWPDAHSVPHWRAESRGFRTDAARSFTPSMRQRLDLARLYRQAQQRSPETLDGLPPLPAPSSCPWTLEELLADPDDEMDGSPEGLDSTAAGASARV